jgi:hypothetical protein
MWSILGGPAAVHLGMQVARVRVRPGCNQSAEYIGTLTAPAGASLLAFAAEVAIGLDVKVILKPPCVFH